VENFENLYSSRVYSYTAFVGSFGFRNFEGGDVMLEIKLAVLFTLPAWCSKIVEGAA